jgi:hypothetical protein
MSGRFSTSRRKNARPLARLIIIILMYMYSAHSQAYECMQMLSHYSRLLFIARPRFALPYISFYCSVSYSSIENHAMDMLPCTRKALRLVLWNKCTNWFFSLLQTFYRAVVSELCSAETSCKEEF